MCIRDRRYYHEKGIIRHGADPKSVDIELGGEIVEGKFLDIEKPTFQDSCAVMVQRALE